MKKLLTVSSLVFFLGVISYINSEAKMLPVIEGSELLDTLASQNNEELNNMTELNAGIYKDVDLEYLDSPNYCFFKEKLNCMDKSFCPLSLMYDSFDSILNLKSDNKSRVMTINQSYFHRLGHHSKCHGYCI